MRGRHAWALVALPSLGPLGLVRECWYTFRWGGGIPQMYLTIWAGFPGPFRGGHLLSLPTGTPGTLHCPVALWSLGSWVPASCRTPLWERGPPGERAPPAPSAPECRLHRTCRVSLEGLEDRVSEGSFSVGAEPLWGTRPGFLWNEEPVFSRRRARPPEAGRSPTLGRGPRGQLVALAREVVTLVGVTGAPWAQDTVGWPGSSRLCPSVLSRLWNPWPGGR